MCLFYFSYDSSCDFFTSVILCCWASNPLNLASVSLKVYMQDRHFPLDEHIRIIDRRRHELTHSDFVKTVCQVITLRRVDKIRCLALGLPTEWLNSEYQLALLLIMKDHLQLSLSDISLWDPAFTEQDKLLIEHYGFEVEEQYEDQDNTLYYIPHGPYKVIFRFASRLKLFLGNNMREFEPPNEISPEDMTRLNQLRNMMIIPLELSRKEKWYTAFSDTALHILGDPK